MLSGLMNNIMDMTSRTAAAKRRGGTEREDPIEKENRTRWEKRFNKYEDAGNFEAAKGMLDVAPPGLDLRPFQKLITMGEQKRQAEEGKNLIANAVISLVSGFLPKTQQQTMSEISAEKPALDIAMGGAAPTVNEIAQAKGQADQQRLKGIEEQTPEAKIARGYLAKEFGAEFQPQNFTQKWVDDAKKGVSTLYMVNDQTGEVREMKSIPIEKSPVENNVTSYLDKITGVRVTEVRDKEGNLLRTERSGKIAPSLAEEQTEKHKQDIIAETVLADGTVVQKAFSLAPGDELPAGWKKVPAETVIEKQLPAQLVSQIGEYGAYVATLEEINNMISSGEVDTGPLEIFRKAFDNWGLSKYMSATKKGTKGRTDRIKLRAIVARLPGLLYAMRGKQLSDKELQIALDMMPKMSQDEETFGIQTQKFEDYMNTILKGKWDAFKNEGYNVGAFKNLVKPEASDLDAFWKGK